MAECGADGISPSGGLTLLKHIWKRWPLAVQLPPSSGSTAVDGFWKEQEKSVKRIALGLRKPSSTTWGRVGTGRQSERPRAGAAELRPPAPSQLFHTGGGGDGASPDNPQGQPSAGLQAVRPLGPVCAPTPRPCHSFLRE